MSPVVLSRGSHVHFVGICGTAMGNVAVGMKKRGFYVTGSDKNVYPPMSRILEQNGIEISPFGIENTAEVDLFVIGNAIPRGNPEVEAVLDQRKPFCSLPALLRDFFVEGRRLIMVTGTHGKTTTTALIFHILNEAGYNPSGMIGGVIRGNESGFSWSPESKFFVMEGDEYDTAFFDKTSKFLKFSPDILVINAIEFDHADIFDSIREIEKSFRFLLRRTPGNAMVLGNGDDPRVLDLKPYLYSGFSGFGFGEENSTRIISVEYKSGKMYLELEISGVRMQLIPPFPGRHNAMNVAAASTVAFKLGVSPDRLSAAVASFPGVRRRFEQRAFHPATGTRVIEDFAHHPTAVAATIRGARELFPEQRVVAFFEPASNTMRKGFLWSELIDSLELADVAVILPVPETRRELVGNSVRPCLDGNITEKLTVMDRDTEVQTVLEQSVRPGDIVLCMSNGSFQGLLEQLIDFVNQNCQWERPNEK